MRPSDFLAPLAAISLFSASCVTVNVNFPESTVQQATDDYVKELYRAKEKNQSDKAMPAAGKKQPPKPQPETGPGAGEGDPAKPATGAPTSGLPSGTTWTAIPRHWLVPGALDLFVSSAMAAEADLQFKVDTPKAVKIREKLAKNVKEVIAQKKAGNLGEGNDGLLVLKTEKPLLKKKLEPIVNQENSDRKELYEEILTANQMAKGRLKDIEKSFMRSFQNESPSGTWLQDPEGAWAQKP